jgi:hypothetical protein
LRLNTRMRRWRMPNLTKIPNKADINWTWLPAPSGPLS